MDLYEYQGKELFRRYGIPVSEGRLVLTLLPNKRCHHLKRDNRCGIYELRPHPCSEFPAGSECCLYAREDVLDVYDGLKPDPDAS